MAPVLAPGAPFARRPALRPPGLASPILLLGGGIELMIGEICGDFVQLDRALIDAMSLCICIPPFTVQVDDC